MSTVWYRARRDSNNCRESWQHAGPSQILTCDATDLLWEDNGPLEAQLREMHPCDEPDATYVIENSVFDFPIYTFSVETAKARAKATGKPVTIRTKAWDYEIHKQVQAPWRCETRHGHAIITYDPKGFATAAKKLKVSRAKKPLLMHEVTKCIEEICTLLPATIGSKFRYMYADHARKSCRLSQLMFVLSFVDLAYGKNKHRTLAPFIHLVKEWKTRYDACQRIKADSEAFVKFMNEEVKVKRFRARALGQPRSSIEGAFT